jgi:hypothetical protein
MQGLNYVELALRGFVVISIDTAVRAVLCRKLSSDNCFNYNGVGKAASVNTGNRVLDSSGDLLWKIISCNTKSLSCRHCKWLDGCCHYLRQHSQSFAGCLKKLRVWGTIVFPNWSGFWKPLRFPKPLPKLARLKNL